MSEFRASEPEDLPRPSAEAVLIRVAITAFIEVAGRKQARRFLRVMAETLASEDSLSEVMPIRPRSDFGEVLRARRGAMAMFRAHLPVYLAKVPPE